MQLLYRYRYNFDDDFFHIKGFLYKIKEIVKCCINPIFVFDGKPPAEKKELIQHRLAEKKTAEKEYNTLKTNLEYNSNMNEDEKHEILNKMDLLKKKFIYISKTQIEEIKKQST